MPAPGLLMIIISSIRSLLVEPLMVHFQRGFPFSLEFHFPLTHLALSFFLRFLRFTSLAVSLTEFPVHRFHTAPRDLCRHLAMTAGTLQDTSANCQSLVTAVICVISTSSCYLRRLLAERRRPSVCVSAEPRLHAVGGEGNALYPVLTAL